MSVEEVGVVDAIGIETASQHVVLTISDHLDWADEHRHLVALQEKINTYLRVIESGEIDTAYPGSERRPRVIDVVMRVPPTDGALEFFRNAQAVLRDTGVVLRTRLFPSA
jgi:hypothetical protein